MTVCTLLFTINILKKKKSNLSKIPITIIQKNNFTKITKLHPFTKLIFLKRRQKLKLIFLGNKFIELESFLVFTIFVILN